MKALIPLILVPLILASCTNPADTARVSALGNLLLTYGESHRVVTHDEAALIREAGLIVLTPTPPAETSGK